MPDKPTIVVSALTEDRIVGIFAEWNRRAEAEKWNGEPSPVSSAAVFIEIAANISETGDLIKRIRK